MSQCRVDLVTAIILGVALILCSADEVSAEGSKSTADGCAFKATAALVTNDAADCCSTESANDGASAGVGASCAGNHGEG